MSKWFKALAAAAIGGAANGGLEMIQTTGHVNKTTLVSAGVGSLVTVLAYLLKSPITTTTTTTEINPNVPVEPKQ